MAEKSEKIKAVPSLEDIQKLEHELDKQGVSWHKRKKILEEQRKSRREVMQKIAREQFLDNLKLYPAKANDSVYKGNLLELMKIGLIFDSEMIRVLTLEKGKDADYIAALKELHQVGIVIDEVVIEALTFDKAKDPEYIAVLKEFVKTGAKIDGDNIRDLSIKAAKDKKRMAVMKELQAAGIDITGGGRGSSIFSYLTPAQAASREYIETLKELQNAGIYVFGWFTHRLPLEHALDREYIKTLKDLAAAGIEVDNDLIGREDFYENTKEPRYAETLKELHKLGVRLDYSFFFDFKGYYIFYLLSDLIFLKEMKKVGIIMDADTVLRLNKIKDPKYFAVLKDLAGSGITVDGDFVNIFSDEDAEDIEYISCLKKIKAQGGPVDRVTLFYFKKKGRYDDETIREYITNVKLIRTINPDFDVSVVSAILKEPEHIPILQDLKAVGVIINRSFISSLIDFTEERKLLEPAYVTGIKRLHQAGIDIDYYDTLSVEDMKDEVYIKLLIDLHKHGIPIDNFFIKKIKQEYSTGNTKDPSYINNYISALTELREAGININEYFAGKFFGHVKDLELISVFKELQASDIGISTGFLSTNEEFNQKIKDPEYRAVLARLKRAGLKRIDDWFIDSLTLEKAKDEAYIEALLEFHKNGIDVDSSFMEHFSLENAHDSAWIKALKEMPEAGINLTEGKFNNILKKYENVLESLTTEQIKDPAYVAVLKDLSTAGTDIIPNVIFTLTPDLAKDSEYIKTLKKLHASKIHISEEIIETLTPEKAKNNAYISGLIDLRKAGIILSGRFRVVKILNLEKAIDEKYRMALKKLKTAGINITADVIECLDPARANNSEYIAALIEFNKNGRHITGDFIKALTLEKVQNVEYFAALKELQFDKNPWGSDFINGLTFEKGTNAAFVKGLMTLKDANINIEFLVGKLSLTKGADARYIEEHIKTRKEQGDRIYRLYAQEIIKKTDKNYLIRAQGLPEAQVNGFYNEKTPRSEVFVQLFAVKNRPNLSPAGKEIIDGLIKDNALPLLQEINDTLLATHDVDSVRRLLKELPLEGLYAIVISGSEEIYTTNFRDVVFPFIMQKMGEQKMDAVDFINSVDSNRETFRTFLETCSKFDKLGEFLDTVKDTAKKKQFLKDFIIGLNAKENGIKNGIAIAETFSYINNDKNLTTELEEYFLEAYESAGRDEKLLYGIIASLHRSDAVTNKEFFDKMNEKYPMRSLSGISNKELVNKNKEIIQQYFFYNDGDGRASYENFMRLYRKDNTWHFREFDTYVLWSKKEGGITILKYANKPDCDVRSEKNGVEDIKKAMKEKDLSTIQVVHRGHSTHVHETLEYMPANAVIVFLGSCGGFNNINAVLNIAEKAHIISTKARGTMVVNDPLLKLIDETMLKGKGIKWDSLWKKAKQMITGEEAKKWFEGYINPAHNTSVQFINSYRKYKGEGG